MDLEGELKGAVGGEVRFDWASRSAYSVDASIFEVEPDGVVVPRNKEEVLAAIGVARKYGRPVIARGAATGTTGGCLGKGLVLDLAKHLDQILEINIAEGYVRCEPGVVLDRLNEVLGHHGYRIAPNLSTSNRATIGGMIANNAAGAHGQMVDHLLEVEIALANGELAVLGRERCPDGLRGILERYREEIQERMPKLARRASGYNLDRLLSARPNYAALIAGSEGTLGVITEATLKIVPVMGPTELMVLPFEDVLQAVKAVPKLLELQPTAIELIDREIIELGRVSKTMQGKLDWLPKGAGALLIVEGKNVQGNVTEPEHVWALRKAGLGLLLSRRTFSRAVGFLEDMAVPPEKLPAFLRSFLGLLKRHGCEAGIYGHAGVGCLHIRPFLDLRMQTQIDKMLRMMDEACDLLVRYGGVPSGEHGDGMIRSRLHRKIFGEKLCRAFREVKRLFDPHGLMGGGREFLREQLRKSPKEDFSTVLHFDEGLPFAANMCNGNGACRNQSGLMCPSFHAEHDEYHTTRARAQAIRTAMNGDHESFTSRELYDVLENCVECKGCKTECPSEVDMAKMKSEFLHHYGKKHGFSLRDRVFANIGKLSRFGRFIPPPKWLLKKLGIAPERSLPPFARRTFSKHLRKHKGSRGKQVVLFNDTFTEHNTPGVGLSAVKLLERLGYEVITPPYQCCGRPALSKGFLPKAQKQADQVMRMLLPYAQKDIPIIGLEPSCILTIRDDYPDLIGQAIRCSTLDEFLLGETFPALSDPQEVYIHLHCHQKSLVGATPTMELLGKIPNLKPHLIESSCCGMAGSYGYEKEHYAFSQLIGERHLFPKVRALPANSTLIANGFSCRCQIEHACNHRPTHLAEFLLRCLEGAD